MKIFPAGIMVAAMFVFASCKEASQESVAAATVPSSFNLDSARKLIDAQNAAFQKAFETDDSTGLANLFTTDGKMMMPGAPSLVGRSAIASAVAGFMKMDIRREAKTTDIWGNDDLIAEEGAVMLYDGKGAEIERAKYLVVWKKEDGQWKLFRDMWNTDLAPKK